VVRRVARHVVDAKQREYDLFYAADIEWTALRPPLVTDGPPQGYRLDLSSEDQLPKLVAPPTHGEGRWLAPTVSRLVKAPMCGL
jgi:hypothetical protein